MSKKVFISKLFKVEKKYYVVVLLNSKSYCLECNARVADHLKELMELDIIALEKPYNITSTTEWEGKTYTNSYVVVGIAKNPVTEGSFEDLVADLATSKEEVAEEPAKEAVESVI